MKVFLKYDITHIIQTWQTCLLDAVRTGIGPADKLIGSCESVSRHVT